MNDVHTPLLYTEDVRLMLGCASQCPVCGHKGVDNLGLEFDSLWAHADYRCQACESRWLLCFEVRPVSMEVIEDSTENTVVPRPYGAMEDSI